jgi:hypothetical protein
MLPGLKSKTRPTYHVLQTKTRPMYVGRVLFFHLRSKLRRTAVALAEAVGPAYK